MGVYSGRATDFGSWNRETQFWEAKVWEATVSQPPISELGVRALSVGGYSELLKKSAN